MENQLLKEVQEKTKEKASREGYIDDLFEDEYAKKIEEGDIVRILDDYEERKNNVIPKWKELKAKARIEARNGYSCLIKEKKYEVFVKRRIEAEKILQEAHLGPQDTKELREEKDNGLVDTIAEIYEIYDLYKLDKNDGEETIDKE